MIKKLLLMAGLAVVLAFSLIAGRGTPTKAFVPPGIQDYNLDWLTVCCRATLARRPVTP